MKLRSILTTMLVVVGLALAAITARSADLTINSWFDVPSLYGGQANITLDGTSRIVNAGQLRATVGGTGEQWVSYCTDLGATLASGPFTQMSLSVAQGLPAWQTPDWAPGGIERAASIYYTFRDEVHSPREAVALQALVWDALYDETPSLTSGRFRLSASGTTPGAFGRATSWLNEDDRILLTGRESWWGPSTSGGDYRPGQGLIGETSIQIIPEPSTYAMLVVAMPMFALTTWWRKFNR